MADYADHPTYSWMTGFIRGKLNARKRRAYVAHLLGGCESCREEVAPIAKVMFRPGRAVAPVGRGAEYDGPIDRAVSYAIDKRQMILQEHEEAEANLADGKLGEGPWTWGLCEVLLERSWRLRHEDPRQMLRFASLAHEAADRLDPKVYGQERTFDMRARAWAEYGNACRVVDDLASAEWAFNRALELRHKGSGAQLLRARLAELIGGLLSHQRQFQPALRALDLAHRLYLRHGHIQETVRVSISRGIYAGRSGDPELGVLILARALDFARENKVDDPKLNFIALHNILLFRVEAGDFRTANLQLFETRALYARYAGSVDSLKLRWIEGRIAAGLGEDKRAERAFLGVREEFNRRGQVYHSAIAGLDLSALWLRRGRLEDVKRLVAEILDVFRSRHVARESVAALLMLREALDRDRVNQDLIRAVASLIELHQDDDVVCAQP
jgi:tetratricopeptide (TPR) repeat protein